MTKSAKSRLYDLQVLLVGTYTDVMTVKFSL